MDFNKITESISKSEHMTVPSFYKSICATIDGIDTEIIYADHSDRTLIIATQYQKLGSLITVTKDQIENIDNITEAVYSVKPISGEENAEEQAATRFIAEQLNIDKKLCLFLCLKKYEPEVIKAVVDILFNLKNNLL